MRGTEEPRFLHLFASLMGQDLFLLLGIFIFLEVLDGSFSWSKLFDVDRLGGGWSCLWLVGFMFVVYL